MEKASPHRNKINFIIKKMKYRYIPHKNKYFIIKEKSFLEYPQ
jgi:hypothetical protein